MPFKPGDRVAVYDGPCRYTGTINNITDTVFVNLDRYKPTKRYHPKQLRRLKPKLASTKEKQQPREWLTIEYSDGTIQDKNINICKSRTAIKATIVTELPPGSAVVTRESLAKAYCGGKSYLRIEELFEALGLNAYSTKEKRK